MTVKVGMTGLDHDTIIIECTDHGIICLCSPGEAIDKVHDHFAAHGVTKLEETNGP